MDTFSRPVAKKLGEYLGVPVIISNRAGAGGGVGLSALARATPDGYTIGMSSVGNLAINQIGRAHVCTPVTNANRVCRPLLDKKSKQTTTQKRQRQPRMRTCDPK